MSLGCKVGDSALMKEDDRDSRKKELKVVLYLCLEIERNLAHRVPFGCAVETLLVYFVLLDAASVPNDMTNIVVYFGRACGSRWPARGFPPDTVAAQPPVARTEQGWPLWPQRV